MSSPARLHRKEEKKFSSVSQLRQLVMDTIEAWVNAHALLCLIICACILIALFTVLIFTLTGVSATESGTVYNHMSNIV